MAKLFALSTQVGGVPVLGDPPLSCNWVQCGRVGTFAAYLFSGTVAQLIAINALSNVYGLVAMTDTGNIRWAELDGIISPAVRTKLNTWLMARGYLTIPAGATYRAIVLAVFKRLNSLWSLDTHDIMDVP